MEYNIRTYWINNLRWEEREGGKSIPKRGERIGTPEVIGERDLNKRGRRDPYPHLLEKKWHATKGERQTDHTLEREKFIGRGERMYHYSLYVQKKES